MRRALILVDLQHDFLPGGALAVPDGDAVLEPAVQQIQSDAYDVVVATQDWHPPGHGSFASVHDGQSVGTVIELHGLPQVLWPDHCVQGSHGAELHPSLPTERIDAVFRKGTDGAVDSYSGFFDNGRRNNTGLSAWLKEKGITDVTVLGLATDYCVKWTALDAQSEGFSVRVLTEASRGVELSAGDVARALDELRDAGVAVM
ncbi:MAG: nicotinamidase/pyrazinamidase [Deltaproteobacteria bacterium]|nr:nicotinamidase/pyrazinamidase [Deltaproteobacteria bacterium]HCH62381.1 bifunctional nicotinamidase/pyrazinamidase [Deltaproteobacteria bacterium]